MTATLVLPTEIANEVQAAIQLNVETAGVLLARVAHAPNGDIRVLGRQLRWVNDSAYIRREGDALTIASEGYVHALAEAEAFGGTCLWLHTHPGEHAVPRPSDHDQIVDQQISDLFRLRSGSPYYGTLIFSPRHSELTFTGYLQHENHAALALDRMWRVGDRWRLTRSFDSALPELPDLFDRNVRAFGSAVQETLSDLRIAIVGCGGTGSAVAEQLVRLGVRHFLLVDPDRLSASNLTRVYGSTVAQVGLQKVRVLAEHLTQIAADVQCDTLASMVTLESTARRLTSCDVVYGCTDDNAGRLVLSRLATYLLTPVIDCGVLLTSDSADQLVGIDGRVTVLSPGQACLVCRNRIDLRRAAAELLAPDERKRRADEGYAPALEHTEPAVVAYTTLVAATAVAELLERLIGYGPTARPSEILLRCHDREISTNVASPRDGHYCHPSSGKLGLGVTQPFLEQVWPT
jgi:molybdopterin/thiamine biosynthesis adenylyltransferase